MQFELFCVVSVIMHTRQTVLGAFVKLRKATVSFVMSVCLSGLEKLLSLCKDFRGILYLKIFRKCIEKI
jgi:hypothetical protein